MQKIKSYIKKRIPEGTVWYNLLFLMYNDMRIIKSRIYHCYPRIQKGIEKNHSNYKFLLIVSWDKNGIVTISQCINELVELSCFQIDILNVHDGFPKIRLRTLQGYDGVIIHNTAAYSDQYYYLINRKLTLKYSGLKILFKQDENHMTDCLLKFVHKQNINLVLSIWDEETAYKIYSENGKFDIAVMQYLTGYVPKEYRKLNYKVEDRKIDVGYRGSVHPAIFGKLCHEKAEIGSDFIKHTRKYDLVTDISSKEEDRIAGEEWLKYLSTCKAVLGVESGSNIVDFTGEVRKGLRTFLKKNPKASNEEILSYLEPYEHGIKYTAISPRHFEAAATKTLQIMYEGEFQGIFKPWIHYVPLKRDYSNIDDVVRVIVDEEKRKEIVEAAYKDIIMNDLYSFETFVCKFDSKVLSMLE